MPTAIPKKQVKDTAIKLWKNDFPNTPIQTNSTEFELYMVKAEQIEAQPTVIDSGAGSNLYSELKSVIKNEGTFNKVWDVIVAYRSQFIAIANSHEGIKSSLGYIPDTVWDCDEEGTLWDGESNCLTTEGETLFGFLKDYFCATELGLDGYDG